MLTRKGVNTNVYLVIVVLEYIMGKGILKTYFEVLGILFLAGYHLHHNTIHCIAFIDRVINYE